MSESMHHFNQLLVDLKAHHDKSPLSTMRHFVTFLKGMKAILLNCSREEKEKIFQAFQEQEKDFEESMSSLKAENFKDKPEEAKKIQVQMQSPEFQKLVADMAETLMEIIKVMSQES